MFAAKRQSFVPATLCQDLVPAIFVAGNLVPGYLVPPWTARRKVAQGRDVSRATIHTCILDWHMAPDGACGVAQSTARSNAEFEAERFRKGFRKGFRKKRESVVESNDACSNPSSEC